MNAANYCPINGQHRAGRARAFSLVEVVVAVGIFALAIVGVIGLLVPTSKNITDVADQDAASRVISAIQSGLQKTAFDEIAASLDGSNAIFFASKDGAKVGPATDTALWPDDSEKFFSFTLNRNTSLSPAGAANDNSAGFLAFTIVLKWPAYARVSENTFATVDPSQQSVMVVPAAITR